MKTKIQQMPLAAAALLACVASTRQADAQRTTMHPKSALASGNKGTNIPFSWGKVRYQQILDANAFSGSSEKSFHRMRLRMASGASTGAFGGQTIELTMRLALTPSGRAAASISSAFAQNKDSATEVVVIHRRSIQLPKITRPEADFVLPFDAGRSFAWKQRNKRSLCVEVIVWSNSNNDRSFSYPIDAYNGIREGEIQQFGSFGGCRDAISNKTAEHYASGLRLGNAYYRCTGRVHTPDLPSLLVLGLHTVDARFDGCPFLVWPWVVLSSASSGTSGDTRFTIPLPDDARMRGASFYTQMWWLRTSGSSTQWIGSRALAQRISPLEDEVVASRVWSTNPEATVGTRHVGYGLVTWFQE